MGQEESVMVDDSVRPDVLKERSLDAIADYIVRKDVSKIVVMVGAGISTSSGIPDFRSPTTGIYANLARLDLPHPEAVFDISYFQENPAPFYALAKEMLPGKHKPTLTHAFIKLLYDRNRLLMCFSQNIDTLEREAGVPGDKLVEAHGSFATHSCTQCKAPFPDNCMRQAVEEGRVVHCEECNGLVKPDIVFFGESLPKAFFENLSQPESADLCIVMGTSLTVQPFASLPSHCRHGTPRLLINLTKAGDIGSRPDDVLLLKDCDIGVRQLARALGWEDDLQNLWEKINPEKAAAEKAAERQQSPTQLPAEGSRKALQAEIERLTAEVDETLHISRSHEDKVRSELERSKHAVDSKDSKGNVSSDRQPSGNGTSPSAPGNKQNVKEDVGSVGQNDNPES
ncbi:hexokinase A [Ascosphaera pollenicola]|nr:hexokinase A [Ascosphaera pollenicola]